MDKSLSLLLTAYAAVNWHSNNMTNIVFFSAAYAAVNTDPETLPEVGTFSAVYAAVNTL